MPDQEHMSYKQLEREIRRRESTLRAIVGVVEGAKFEMRWGQSVDTKDKSEVILVHT